MLAAFDKYSRSGRLSCNVVRIIEICDLKKFPVAGPKKACIWRPKMHIWRPKCVIWEIKMRVFR
jgi:hypothetical protein